jgi:uncharacterized membrane protein
MTALSRQPHQSDMATMQTINVVVFNPWFGRPFSLAPVACALAMLIALARWPAPDVPWVVAGGGLFLIGPHHASKTQESPSEMAPGAWLPSSGPLVGCRRPLHEHVKGAGARSLARVDIALLGDP